MMRSSLKCSDMDGRTCVAYVRCVRALHENVDFIYNPRESELILASATKLVK